MDPNPKKFPVLSYVLTRLNSIRSPKTSSSNRSFSDIEQPELSPSPKCIDSHHVELMSRMPRLNQPELLASMAGAIADVAQTRSVLHALGERPDHESVDSARARIAEIDMELEREVEELFRTVCGDDLKKEEEEEIRKKKEREKQVYRAVVQLDEMHEAYEVLLREAEERLIGIYGENTESGGGKEDRETGLEFNGEIVEILRDSREGRCVEKVDLSGKMLRILPEEFGRIAGLVVLNLSNNQLEVIPDSIAGLEQLEELRLSTNVLVSLPDSIGLLVNLKVLDVSGNKLRRLPDSISCCRSLVELDVSYNELTYLPTNIGLELANLQKLMVHLNKIRFLPASVCEMKSLRLLDAHFNELHGLPRAFGKLTNLEFLDLSSNFSDLTELPETFGDLISLRELDLSNNQIHALPDTFGFLKNLVNLNLEQNPIEIPPTEVVNNGVKAVIEFMDNRSIEIIQQEELRRAADAEAASHTGWLTRSTSLLNSWVSGVSESVSGYMGAGQRSQRDPFLDQEL